MKIDAVVAACVGAVCAAVVCSGSALAGPLVPPAGPVSDTEVALGYKTLFQVEPRTPLSQDMVPITINQPGSYYLTENLFPTVVGQPALIEINADHVTLDLNGFVLDCQTEVATASFGVAGGGDSMVVRNGQIVQAQSAGVFPTGTNPATIEDVSFSGCNNAVQFEVGTVRRCSAFDCVTGFTVTGDGVVDACYVRGGSVGIRSFGPALVAGCYVEGVASDGIDMQDGSTVRGCTVVNAGGKGIDVLDACAVEFCLVENAGTDGIEAGDSCVITGCVVRTSGTDGIEADDDAVVRDCVVDGTGTQSGFDLGAGASVIGCVSVRADTDGFSLGIGAHAESCTARLSGQQGFDFNEHCQAVDCLASGNAGTGFRASGSGSNRYVTVRDCQSTNNGVHGFELTSYCVADRCSATFNGSDGFRVALDCQVTNCSSINNGQIGFGVGIRATSNSALIDSNLVLDNDEGIRTEAGNNIVMRNVSRFNSGAEYSFFGSETAGAIQTNPATAGPWDNFE